VRAGLAAVTNWNPDPNPVQYVTVVDHRHIQQLRTKLEEAYSALHLSIGTYAHAGPNHDDPIYAVDFQELRTKIKDAWTALSSSSLITQAYDGNGLRVKKNEYGTVTYYLRSTVLGGQVVAEVNGSGSWQRGYVYSGSSLLAIQQSGVFWVHEDPVTKSKRVTDVNGYVVSAVEIDPWGADTTASWAQAFQPRKYTSYERDLNGGDEAMFRRYNRKHARFDQPDPYGGSYALSDPQSMNRYASVQNDPINLVDPTGTICQIIWEGSMYYLPLCGPGDDRWGGFTSAGGKGGGGDRGREPLKGDQKKAYDSAKNQAKKLSDECKMFLNAHSISPGSVLEALGKQKAYDGTTSTISIADAGLFVFGEPESTKSVRDFFAEDPDLIAATGVTGAIASGLKTRFDSYFGSTPIEAIFVLHEAIHSATALDDLQLGLKLGAYNPRSKKSIQEQIDDALKAHGCGGG
jgi:RHS repeat-associated protein